MKLIDLGNASYVYANLIFHVKAMDSTVAVWFGHNVRDCNRENITCNSPAEAQAAAARIRDDVENATAPSLDLLGRVRCPDCGYYPGERKPAESAARGEKGQEDPPATLPLPTKKKS